MIIQDNYIDLFGPKADGAELQSRGLRYDQWMIQLRHARDGGYGAAAAAQMKFIFEAVDFAPENDEQSQTESDEMPLHVVLEPHDWELSGRESEAVQAASRAQTDQGDINENEKRSRNHITWDEESGRFRIGDRTCAICLPNTPHRVLNAPPFDNDMHTRESGADRGAGAASQSEGEGKIAGGGPHPPDDSCNCDWFEDDGGDEIEDDDRVEVYGDDEVVKSDAGEVREEMDAEEARADNNAEEVKVENNAESVREEMEAGDIATEEVDDEDASDDADTEAEEGTIASGKKYVRELKRQKGNTDLYK